MCSRCQYAPPPRRGGSQAVLHALPCCAPRDPPRVASRARVASPHAAPPVPRESSIPLACVAAPKAGATCCASSARVPSALATGTVQYACGDRKAFATHISETFLFKKPPIFVTTTQRLPHKRNTLGVESPHARRPLLSLGVSAQIISVSANRLRACRWHIYDSRVAVRCSASRDRAGA